MNTDYYQPPDLVPLEYHADNISGCYLPPDEILMRKEDAMLDEGRQWDRKFEFYHSRLESKSSESLKI